jgi:hypothetical protein
MGKNKQNIKINFKFIFDDKNINKYKNKNKFNFDDINTSNIK